MRITDRRTTMNRKLADTKTRLPVLGIVLLVTGLAGCVSPDTARLVAKTASTPFYKITVNFDADDCPTSVTPPTQVGCSLTGGGICVERGRSVQWVGNPVGTAFEVYFDPFVGRPYISRGPDEKTTPVTVRRDTLPGDYKYSVFGTVCSGPNPVLDPAFRVVD